MTVLTDEDITSKLNSATRKGKNYGLKVVRKKRIDFGKPKAEHLADYNRYELGQVLGFILEYYFKTFLNEVSASKMNKVYYPSSKNWDRNYHTKIPCYDFTTSCDAVVEFKSHRDKHGICLSCLSCLYNLKGVEKQLDEMANSGKPFMLAVFMYKDPAMLLAQDFSILKYHSVQIILGQNEQSRLLKIEGENFKNFVSASNLSPLWQQTISSFINLNLAIG